MRKVCNILGDAVGGYLAAQSDVAKPCDGGFVEGNQTFYPMRADRVDSFCRSLASRNKLNSRQTFPAVRLAGN